MSGPPPTAKQAKQAEHTARQKAWHAEYVKWRNENPPQVPVGVQPYVLSEDKKRMKILNDRMNQMFDIKMSEEEYEKKVTPLVERLEKEGADEHKNRAKQAAEHAHKKQWLAELNRQEEEELNQLVALCLDHH